MSPGCYRWDVAARVLLAFVGGFLVVSGSGALVAHAAYRLGLMSLAQGVHLMTLAGFVVWCAVAMWVFYEPRLYVATSVVAACTLVPLSAALLLRFGVPG